MHQKKKRRNEKRKKQAYTSRTKKMRSRPESSSHRRIKERIGFSKNNLQLDVAAQNSFGKINYEVGNKVKINFDKENIVGFV